MKDRIESKWGQLSPREIGTDILWKIKKKHLLIIILKTKKKPA